MIREVEYSFKLMFEDRNIQIKAYNLNTILAEKIESILDRNVVNTGARDFYSGLLKFFIVINIKQGRTNVCIRLIFCEHNDKGLSVEYIADINDIAVEDVKKVIERSDS